MFVGAAGSRSRLHADSWGTGFWLAVLAGRKRFRLFNASHARRDAASSCLYPAGGRDALRLDSYAQRFELDAFAPDRARHARALAGGGDCVAWEGVVGPGELVFIPAEWPHAVENLDETLAISYNFVDAHTVASFARFAAPMVEARRAEAARAALAELRAPARAEPAAGAVGDDDPADRASAPFEVVRATVSLAALHARLAPLARDDGADDGEADLRWDQFLRRNRAAHQPGYDDAAYRAALVRFLERPEAWPPLATLPAARPGGGRGDAAARRAGAGASASDDETAACFERPGVRVAGPCACHPSCARCGFGPRPSGEADCVACAARGGAVRPMRSQFGLDVGYCDHDARALSRAPARRLAAPPGARAPPAQFHNANGSVNVRSQFLGPGDEAILAALADPAAWEACVAAPDAARWWDGRGEARDVWRQLGARVWGGQEVADGLAGLEYWCSVQRAGETKQWHQDKDEERLRREGVHAFPTLGAVFYGRAHGPLSGGMLEIAPVGVGLGEVGRRGGEPGLEDAAAALADAERIAPEYNRLVVFDTRRLHRVTPLRAGTRYSFQINLWHSRPLSAGPELADRARSPR